MTKLAFSSARWANTCTLALLAACGAQTGSTPSPTGEAGAIGVPAMAGRAGSDHAAAGTGAPSDSGGRGGSRANGSAGVGTTTAGAGAGGSVMTAAGAAGSAAVSGSSGSAAAGVSGATGASGMSGRAGEPAAGSGGVAAEPPKGGALDKTIVVGAGETFDGKGQRFTAGSALGDGSQDEGQQPLFKLEAGATLENVVLGAPAADGVHCHGDATLRNIVWEDIGEDALTIKEAGTVKLDGGSAKNGDDKVFQINAASRFEVSNFKASNAGKFIRQNGGTDFKVEVVIDRCDISNMDESIFRTDSKTSTVEMTNTRYSKIGDELFMGVSSGNIKQMNNTEY